MDNILVNGANGWLGGNVVRLAGAEIVTAGVRQNRGQFGNQILVDSDGQSERGALANFKAIINCAGQVSGNSAELEQANVAHAVQLAKSAKAEGVSRFIQVSSFSVYGNTELINAQTPASPNSAYGHSKLDAENALLSLCSAEFTVTCVRLPFMFSAFKPALIGKLINAIRTLPYWPITPEPIRRSMLTYETAANLLLKASVDGPSGAVAVADPQLFTIDMLVSAMRRHGLSTAKLLTVPAWCAAPVQRLLPGIGRRLFQSSVLDDELNWGRDRMDGYRIEPAIDALLREISQPKN